MTFVMIFEGSSRRTRLLVLMAGGHTNLKPYQIVFLKFYWICSICVNMLDVFLNPFKLHLYYSHPQGYLSWTFEFVTYYCSYRSISRLCWFTLSDTSEYLDTSFTFCFFFCKGRSTTNLNTHLSFDPLQKNTSHRSFAGIPFDVAERLDSIPFFVIWNTLTHHGCNIYITMFNDVLDMLGGLSSTWSASNGLLQGDPLSGVILNCILI